MDLELGVDINSKVIIAIVHSFVFLPSMYTYTNTGATSHMWLLLLRRFSSVGLCATPQTAAHQASPSLGFSRQEHWSGLPFPAPVRESEVAQLCPTLSDPMDLQPTRLLHPWDFPGKSTGVGCHCLLQVTRGY